MGSKRTGTAPLCHSGNCVVCRPLVVPYNSGIVLSHFRRTEILITLPSGVCTHRCRTYWRRGAIGEGSKPRQRRGDGCTKGYSGIASARRYQFTRPGIESNRSKLTRKTVKFHLWQYLWFLSLVCIILWYNGFVRCFQNGKGNVVHLESRPSKEQGVQFDILAKVDMTRKDLLALMKTLRQSSTLASITILAEDNINVKNPWFPRHARDLDNCNHLMTKYEPELDMNHPGFSDKVYRNRRKEIANIAFEYKLYVIYSAGIHICFICDYWLYSDFFSRNSRHAFWFTAATWSQLSNTLLTKSVHGPQFSTTCWIWCPSTSVWNTGTLSRCCRTTTYSLLTRSRNLRIWMNSWKSTQDSLSGRRLVCWRPETSSPALRSVCSKARSTFVTAHHHSTHLNRKYLVRQTC